MKVINKNFPLFLLCGVVIENNALVKIEKRVNAFKHKYFKTTHIVLHSRSIRKCEGAFQILFDSTLKKRFYRDMNSIFRSGEYCLIGSGIQKEEHIKKYGKRAKDPYALSLTFILERLVLYLEKKNHQGSFRVLAEQRGKREDKMLLSHFNSIVDGGSFYIEPDKFTRRLKGITFHDKGENIIGLQLADMCAYPLARHVLNPEEPYVPFEVIEEKIYCDEFGKYEGWGLKVFP